MQSPKRAILLGVLAWLAWMPVIMALAMVMPESFTNSRTGIATPSVLLVIATLIFTLLYLRKVGQGTLWEGLYVGFAWMVIFGIFDVAHYAMMGPVNIGNYLATQFSGYLIIPVVTGLLFRFAQTKKASCCTSGGTC